MPMHIATRKPGVVWNGSFFVHHSLALVNREMALGLLECPGFTDKFELALGEVGPRAFAPAAGDRCGPLLAHAGYAPEDVKVTVRHSWPPDFSRTSAGRLVLCQPWEFGSIPRDWIACIDNAVDEIWVYTEHVRQTYVDSGVPDAKVRVVPLGIDPGTFAPGLAPFDFSLHAETRAVLADDFKFLFVGGTIPRKGIDVLLDAFDRAFRAADPVTLIIKDFGTNSFYADQGAGMLIRALQAKPGGARITYITEDLAESEIASLYAACNCVVQPYRGEGYGLPIAEAMACGTPAIVTGAGAALDFATAENSYLIPASRQFLNQTQISGMETVARPYWYEPDREALQALLRHVIEHRDEARERGRVAAADMVRNHTWAHAAAVAAQGISELAASGKRTSITSFSLPMGLANFGLCALNGLELPADLADARYEDRKQIALSETRGSDWAQAVEHLETCLADRPDDWDTVNALAVTKFRLGEGDEALSLLRRGVSEASNPRDFHHNLAFILLARANPDEALEALEQATMAFRCSPQSADVRNTLDRAKMWALKSARGILRACPNRMRARGRHDERYRRLMDAIRAADTALQQSGEPGEELIAIQPAETPVVNRISLVMIVKNEERFLRKCLQSVQGVVDEIVVVDTGSTDSTPDIAREFGAKLVHHAWNDDFSEARNVALANATGNWALWLDADEEVAEEARAEFRTAVETAAADTGGFMVQFRNWLQSADRREDTDMAIHHACRLFRLVSGVRFEGRIHEQNLRSLQNLGYKYVYLPGLTLDHFGYCEEVMTARNKHERFIRMLTREVAECPDPTLRHFHLFNLGNAYFTLGDMENATVYLRQAAEQPDLKEEFTATLFTELVTALNRLGRAEEGLAVCADADRLGMQQAGVEFARGYCLLHLLRYSEAEAAFRTALRIGQSATPLALTGDRGTSSYKARYGLALALVGQERYGEARGECTEALRGQAGFVEARYLLAVACERLNRSAEARAALEQVVEVAPHHVEARRDLGRLLYDVADYSAALPHLEAAALLDPDNRENCGRLAACCEATGSLSAAREAYERLRRLAPDSPEICVNFGRVLAATGAEEEALGCFSQAIQLDPKFGNAYFNAGDLLYRLGQYGSAAQTYIAGLEVKPDQPSGFFVLGNCFFRVRNFEAAVVSYRQELAQNPGHTEARHNLELVEALDSESRAA